ncbi:TPA: hypothetical protein N0F65_010922 [Lagenidium giganteum]|uniref:CCHC-type domain-containing protein n=1 Tax=Lagenidium giganteum TaxID=4803 RepID=A0AAV2Z0M9_9STRA|nr:TPA: hypothetical protein N0F65_010922 [Lagenidium giganteum]
MSLARKDLLDHIMPVKETAEWKVANMKAHAILSKLLSPMYQTMVREATTALEAWNTLRDFFVQQNIHNGVKLRKELHEFQIDSGGNLMEHFFRFEDLCLRLTAVGERLDHRERLGILLGSLPSEYDTKVKIIEPRENVNLLEAKEMLRREYEALLKQEKQESAFKAGGGRRGGRREKPRDKHAPSRRDRGEKRGDDTRRDGSRFTGKCFECGREGHKQAQCKKRRQERDDDEYVFSATSENSAAWLRDSGESSHMTHEAKAFVELRDLKTKMTISIAHGHRLEVQGVGAVRLTTSTGVGVRLTDVL